VLQTEAVVLLSEMILNCFQLFNQGERSKNFNLTSFNGPATLNADFYFSSFFEHLNHIALGCGSRPGRGSENRNDFEGQMREKSRKTLEESR
jgi:hypothetical protein